MFHMKKKKKRRLWVQNGIQNIRNGQYFSEKIIINLINGYLKTAEILYCAIIYT